MYPLRPRMRLRRALTIVTIIWILAILLALPNFLTYTIETQTYANGDQRVACFPIWPDGPTNQSNIEYM